MFKAMLAVFALALVLPVLGVVTPAGSTAPAADAAVRQVGKTVLMPQIVHPGARVAPSVKARLTGWVKFRPVRKGRPVVVQRRVGKGPWQTYVVKRQNGNGVVRFNGPAKHPNGLWWNYRGVAKPWKGLPRKASSGQRAKVWEERFRDEFRGPVLDLEKWNYRHFVNSEELNPNYGYSPSSDRACSKSDPRAVQQGGGSLKLQVIEDTTRRETAGDCNGTNRSGEPWPKNKKWYLNGHIGTQGRFEPKFGIAAARIKFDRDVGAHGAFWLQSTIADIPGKGPAADGAEIDVVEYFGKDFAKGDIYSFIHYLDRQDNKQKAPSGATAKTAVTAARKALRGKADDWFKQYHVFSVEWTPNAYIFRVDGIQTRRITRGVSRQPEYLILSMLSSGWELERMERQGTKTMNVDWVRYWQHRNP